MDKIFTDIKQRIIQFIENQSIGKENFYRITGISASNFKGKGALSEIGGDKIVKILTVYPKINPEWLLLGNGNMLREISTELNEPISIYSTEHKNSELVISLLKQVEDLKKDKEDLRNDKRLLQQIIDHKLGKKSAS